MLNVGYLRPGRLETLTNAVSGPFVFSSITHLIEFSNDNRVGADGSVSISSVDSLVNYTTAAHAYGKKISIGIKDPVPPAGDIWPPFALAPP